EPPRGINAGGASMIGAHGQPIKQIVPKTIQLAKRPGKKAKAKKKGEKGGVNCYLNGSKKPISQGSNKNVNHHAERLAVAQAPPGDIAVEQNAWPCWQCHTWLGQQAAALGVTIRVTITGDQGGYSQDHQQAFGATGLLVYP